jgi:hypothetical protein
VEDLLLKVSQDIAFGSTSIPDGTRQLFDEAAKALTA